MNQTSMNKIRRSNFFIIALSGALALTACGKQEAPPPPAAKPATTPVAPAPAPTPPPAAPATVPTVSVASVTLGNALGADGKIAAPSVTFAPKDTIYAVVATNSTGMASATISAHWTYQGGILVSNDDENIAANGPASTTFHIAKPDGFPAGKYTLEVSVAGKLANTATFEVK
jgi:hypothetical protein